MQAGLRVRPDADHLTVGPSDPDPRRHARLRRQFWTRELQLPRWEWCTPRYDELPLPPVPPWPHDGTVVVWTSSRPSERLFSWRAIDRLAETRVELWQAEPMHPEVFVESVAHLAPADVLRSLRETARRLTRNEILHARRCWRAFASGDLGSLARLTRAEPPVLGWLRHALPRQRRGGLLLSHLDEALLRPFGPWKTPLQALRQNESWRDILGTYGDHFLLTRLWRWTLGDRPALSAKPGRGSRPWDWGAAALKLTPFGRSCFDALPDSVPAIWFGGHEVYGPDAWVVSRSGRLARVASLRGAASRAERTRPAARRRS